MNNNKLAFGAQGFLPLWKMPTKIKKIYGWWDVPKFISAMVIYLIN